jgi:IclR family pca regulon transcriptional regulator
MTARQQRDEPVPSAPYSLIERDGLSDSSADIVQAFVRGLAVIRAFAGDEPELTLSEVARRAEIPRAAARRLLRTLVRLGYVQVDQNRFSLRPRILELGYAYLSTLSLPEIATPHLKALANRVGESTYLSVVDGHDNLCVAHFAVRRIWTAMITVGTRLPAFATASGRVMMASWDDEVVDALLHDREYEKITPYTVTDPGQLKKELALVRKQGWALVDQELEEGLRTLAAPIHERRRAIAALSVSTFASIADSQAGRAAELLEALLETAAAISADMDAAAQSR